jgi:hypothetical protein
MGMMDEKPVQGKQEDWLIRARDWKKETGSWLS